MRKKSPRLFILLMWVLLPLLFKAQDAWSQIDEDESDLYAETKQVNQFFRRFNAEESVTGERYYPGDKHYRDPKMRRRYLQMLFDEQNPYLTEDVREYFIRDITRTNPPVYLDFHGGNWFAEVHARFRFHGKEEEALLFLKLQEQAVGSKWVFDAVYMEALEGAFAPDTASPDSFLHPLSHELDFMNLGKLFRNHGSLGNFISRDRRPDYLSVFAFEVKQGNLVFEAVTEVRFHFLQVKDWYFEIAQFNRAGNNKGWLISKLTQIPEDKKYILIDYIYNNFH